MTEPLCNEPDFAAIVEGMVADEAPELFAVVQEDLMCADAWIAAWGIAFEGRAEVVSVESGLRMSLREPGGALRIFGRDDELRARLIWVNQAECGARSDPS